MPKYRSLSKAFNRINKDAFNNKLPRLKLSYRLLRKNAGEFRGAYYKNHKPVSIKVCKIKPEIRIAKKFGNTKAPEWIFWGLLLHEMVHYYLWYRQIKSVTHGKEFRKIIIRKSKRLSKIFKKKVIAFY